MASPASPRSANTLRMAPGAATARCSRERSRNTPITSPRSKSRMSDIAPAGRLGSAHTAFRVLVVDDDPDMAAFLSHLLESDGMVADTVYGGDAAMVYIMATPPDLVLLDV